MTISDGLRPLEILLIEDNRAHALLTQEALAECDLRSRLNTVGNGVDAIEYLERRGKHATAVRPDLILLDLNLPRLDGRELLAWLRRDPDLRLIPVVVLTTSSSEQDVRAAYALQTNGYIVKPLDFDKFAQVVRETVGYWFKAATRPPS
jgi:CheY-like chemotaxis protein